MLPRLTTTAGTNPDGSAIVQGGLDDVRAAVAKRYAQLASDSANMSSGAITYTGMAINWTYTDASTPVNTYSANISSYNVTPLSNYLDSITSNVTTSLQNVGSSGTGPAQRTALLEQYKADVRSATSNWVDSEMLDQFAQAMSNSTMSSFYGWLQDVGSAAKRKLMGAASQFKPTTIMDNVTNVLSAGVYICKDLVMPAVMYVGQFLFRAVAELAILGMMVCLPFWLFDGPLKKAFTGSVETLLAASLMVPFWAFFQMIMDALYGGFCALFSAAFAAAGAAVALVSGGAALPEMIACSMLILTAGYLIASLVLAWKVPGLTRGFLSGGSWIAGVMGSAAVGAGAAVLIAGGMAVAGAGALAAGGGGVGGLARMAASRVGNMGARTVNVASRAVGKGNALGVPQIQKPSWATSKVAQGRAYRAAGRIGVNLLKHGGDPMRALGGYMKSRNKNRGEDED